MFLTSPRKHQKTLLFFCAAGREPDDGYIFGETGKGFERMNLACPTKDLLSALERIRHALDPPERRFVSELLNFIIGENETKMKQTCAIVTA